MAYSDDFLVVEVDHIKNVLLWMVFWYNKDK